MKAIILQRICQLKSDEEAKTLRKLVEENVSDPAARTKIVEKIDSAEKEAPELQQKAREIDKKM